MLRRLLFGAIPVLAALAVAPAAATASSAMTWSAPAHVDGYGLKAASCPSTSLCVLGDVNGNVLTSTNPESGGWIGTTLDLGHPITGVSCPSTSLCVAVAADGNVYTSTDPAARAWTLHTNLGASPDSLSCAARDLCAAVGPGSISTSNNLPSGAWSTGTPPGSPNLESVACVTLWLCVAGDDSGDVLTSQNPERGPNWTQKNIDGTNSITAVSCSMDPRVCVAGDSAGNILTSTDATGVSWPNRSQPDPGNGITGISCRPAPLCVAVDDAGNALTAGDPSGAWSAPTPIDGTRPLTAVSCSPGVLCVATDGSGNVVLGAPVSKPTNMAPPSISGHLALGQQLFEAHGAWTGDPSSYAYQWLDCNASGSACVPIAGATSSSYRVQRSDANHTIRVDEAATNAGGTSAPASSPATAMPQVPPQMTALPTLTGQLIVGRTLHAKPGGWSGSAPMAYEYQWKRCKGTCSTIGGVYSGTYKLRSADRGFLIRVQVTAGNAAGQATAQSTQTGPVVSPRDIQALMLKAIVPHGRGARFTPILRRGYVIVFKAPIAGTLHVTWKLGHKVVARGTLVLGRNSRRQLRLHLTNRGARLLERTSRLKLTAYGSFVPSGGGAIAAHKRFKLVRR